VSLPRPPQSLGYLGFDLREAGQRPFSMSVFTQSSSRHTFRTWVHRLSGEAWSFSPAPGHRPPSVRVASLCSCRVVFSWFAQLPQSAGYFFKNGIQWDFSTVEYVPLKPLPRPRAHSQIGPVSFLPEVTTKATQTLGYWILVMAREIVLFFHSCSIAAFLLL